MSMHLIHALYDGQTSLPNDFYFYTQILENRDFASVSPQVYFLLKKQGRLAEVPRFFQAHLKDQFNETLLQNIFIKNQLERLLHHFEDLGIDVIPLKGVGFAEKYFGHIGARATSDIDVLIRMPDLEKAIEGVGNLGFTAEENRIRDHFHRSFSKELPESPIPLTVELHWDILRQNTAAFDVGTFWSHATPVKPSVHIKELSHPHAFYMICLHGWRHNLQSLKYFLDIIQMIYLLQDELDFPVLLENAAAHRTLKRIIRTLSIVYRECPFLDEIKEFRDKRTKIYWQYDAMNPLNGKHLKRYIDFIDYQFLSYDLPKHVVAEVLHWIKSDMISAVRSR